MTDWVASRSFFCLKTTQKLPENETRLPEHYPDALQGTFYKK